MGAFSPRCIDKPWGYELLLAHTDKYVGKILFIEKGHRLSKQYHKVKDETLYILEGVLTLLTNDSEYSETHQPGISIHIPPGTIHRLEAHHGDVRILEVSTPELDDVVRLADDYKREQKNE